MENTSYGYVEGAGYSTRSRLGESHQPSMTSELEGDKMVLKICKPPRDKDSLLSLCWQSCTWAVSQSLAGSTPWQHPMVVDHLVSRSYLPSAAGQAAYYQAETCGGLAVCQPLTRISNHHQAQGENPAEEVSQSVSQSDDVRRKKLEIRNNLTLHQVFFNKPTNQPEAAMTSIQKQYTQDPYRSDSR